MARNLSVCAVGLGIEFGDVDDNLDKIGAALTAGPDAAHACWCFSNCPPRQGRVLDRTATRRGGQRDRSGLGRGDDHQPGLASRRGLQPVAPFHWYLQWSGVLVPVLLTVGGLVLYRVRIRHRTWILAEHAAVTTTASGGPLSPAPGGTDPSRPSDDPNLAVPDLTAPAERA